MEYQITAEYWLSQAVDKVRGFLLLEQNATKTWTVESLQSALAAVGISYSTDQLGLIGADLIKKGVIEEVV